MRVFDNAPDKKKTKTKKKQQKQTNKKTAVFKENISFVENFVELWYKEKIEKKLIVLRINFKKSCFNLTYSIFYTEINSEENILEEEMRTKQVVPQSANVTYCGFMSKW